MQTDTLTRSISKTIFIANYAIVVEAISQLQKIIDSIISISGVMIRF